MYHYVPEKINVAINGKYIEYKSKCYENISIEQYLENVRPYLGNVTHDLRESGGWKICLTMKSNFMLSKHGGNSQLLHSKSDNID